MQTVIRQKGTRMVQYRLDCVVIVLGNPFMLAEKLATPLFREYLIFLNEF